MNFTLTITASEELLGVLKALTGLQLSPGKNKKSEKMHIVPGQQAETASENGASVDGPVTLEAIRVKVKEKSEAGKKGEIKSILASFGVDKVPSLSPEQYADFLAQIIAIN